MYIKKLIILLFLFSCLLLAGTDENFADSLFKISDYGGASLFYRRAAFSAETKLEKNRLDLKLADSLLKTGQKTEAEKILNDLIENSVEYKKAAQKKLAEHYYNSGNFESAAFEMKDFSKNYNDDKYYYLSAWAYLQIEDYDRATDTFAVLADKKDSVYKSAAEKLAVTVKKGKELPQKNILTAQVFSYILPGAGQIYANNWQDGLVSFLVNGITISLLSNAIQGKRTGEALVWLTLESAWYFGGVYSAGNSAQKYNKSVKERFREDLENEYNPSKLLE